MSARRKRLLTAATWTVCAGIAACVLLPLAQMVQFPAPPDTYSASPKETALPQPAPDNDSLDINAASLEELMALPGIGEGLARAIVAERERSGAFAFIEDLTSVPGIGTARFEAIAPYIRVSAPPTNE